MPRFSADLYSARWKATERCDIDLSPEEMSITLGALKHRCVWRKAQEPVWEGERLEAVLRNDGIHPPVGLPEMLVHLWRAWRGGGLDEAQTRTEIRALADWINRVTRGKPDTGFWSAYF